MYKIRGSFRDYLRFSKRINKLKRRLIYRTYGSHLSFNCFYQRIEISRYPGLPYESMLRIYQKFAQPPSLHRLRLWTKCKTRLGLGFCRFKVGLQSRRLDQCGSPGFQSGENMIRTFSRAVGSAHKIDAGFYFFINRCIK